MGLFSSSSRSSTTNQTTNDQDTVNNVDYGDIDGVKQNVNVIDSAGASINVSDLGAVNRSFEFAESALDSVTESFGQLFTGQMASFNKLADSPVIRGETDQLLGRFFQFSIVGGAVIVAALFARK